MTRASPPPLVGIPACVREVGIHPFHVVGEKYILALARAARALPLLIPALGAELDIDDLLARLDGVFLSGSLSNVEPQHYGARRIRPDDLRDAQRDRTTLPLIRAALEKAVPLLATCRGIQELNVALGGTLHQNVHEVPGLMDHREDRSQPREVQYAPAHKLRLAPRGLLAELAGASEVEVNSLHAQGIDRLAPRLAVEATAPDGLVEGVRVKDAPAFALGVQWHPEWKVMENPFSVAIFRAFGDACRARASQRSARGSVTGRVA